MRGGIRQDAEKKRSEASTIRRKRRREGESGVVWTSGERDLASGRKKRCDVASGRKERCDASQDAQDAQDAEYPALASGCNAGGSDARSVFADANRFLAPQIPEAIWGKYFKGRKMRGIAEPDFLGRINGTMVCLTCAILCHTLRAWQTGI